MPRAWATRWATSEQVLGVAAQAAALVGDWAAVLIITAGWTGARWGELTGLRRHNTHLNDSTITLPPFLTDLLRAHLDTHDHPHVFVTDNGELLRRPNFSRRAMRPAADGNHHRARPRTRVHPIQPGLVSHGLRHSHKTWMIVSAHLNTPTSSATRQPRQPAPATPEPPRSGLNRSSTPPRQAQPSSADVNHTYPNHTPGRLMPLAPDRGGEPSSRPHMAVSQSPALIVS